MQQEGEGASLRLLQVPAADGQEPTAACSHLDAVTCQLYCHHCRLHLSYEALQADRHGARL
jgi:hypothetical protein